VRTIKRATLGITADVDGVAGAVLLVELADRLGLPGVLDRWASITASPGSAPDGPRCGPTWR
jgi:hypothetical protein